jgi:hypothetical protein
VAATLGRIILVQLCLVGAVGLGCGSDGDRRNNQGQGGLTGVAGTQGLAGASGGAPLGGAGNGNGGTNHGGGGSSAGQGGQPGQPASARVQFVLKEVH